MRCVKMHRNVFYNIKKKVNTNWAWVSYLHMYMLPHPLLAPKNWAWVIAASQNKRLEYTKVVT